MSKSLRKRNSRKNSRRVSRRSRRLRKNNKRNTKRNIKRNTKRNTRRVSKKNRTRKNVKKHGGGERRSVKTKPGDPIQERRDRMNRLRKLRRGEKKEEKRKIQEPEESESEPEEYEPEPEEYEPEPEESEVSREKNRIEIFNKISKKKKELISIKKPNDRDLFVKMFFFYLWLYYQNKDKQFEYDSNKDYCKEYIDLLESQNDLRNYKVDEALSFVETNLKNVQMIHYKYNLIFNP